MKDDRLLDDDDLKDAFRSVRDAYDGMNPEANSTLHRALFRTRTRERRHRFTRWVVIPIAAVLAASTAWAGVTGKLTPAVQSVLESFHAERTPPAPARAHPAATSASTSTSVSSVSAPAEESPPAEVAAVSEPALQPASTPESASPAPIARPVAAPPPPIDRPLLAVTPPSSEEAPKEAPGEAPVVTHEPAPAPPPVASAPDPHAPLFAEAHRLHFIDRDPARALAAWDRYLATAPNGRFAPEARYNRALALVRLGRVAEAKTELEAFARGTYGSYRRDEANALLEALASDASRP